MHWALNTIRKWLVTNSHNLHATIVPVGIYYQGDDYCSLEGVWQKLSKTGDYFLL